MLVLLLILSSGSLLWSASAAEGSASLRYDLRAGDRLVFRATLDQEVVRDGKAQAARIEWSSQVLVAARERDGWLVGFARNRARAELLHASAMSRERMLHERALFAAILRRYPERFADANRIDARGGLLLPATALREWPSETLCETRELPPLPEGSQALDRISGSLLGMRFTETAEDALDGERCLRVEARGDAGLRLRYWFSPTLSLPRRVEYFSEYATAKGVRLKETLVVTFVERRRGQTFMSWLYATETRLAALEALRNADKPLIEEERLRALADVEDTAVLRRALSFACRFSLTPFSLSQVASFIASADPRVRALAIRTLPADEERGAAALAARLEADEDPATRVAVEAWRKRGIHQESTGKPFAAFGSRIRLLRRRDLPAWPYVIHVPDEYRGDEPLPLLVVLSGGAGRALAGALASRETIDRLGWLVVFPQARGMWWHASTTEMIQALLREVGEDYSVDWDRVYFVGMSNGGSGAYYYASLWPHRLAAVVSIMGAGAVVPGTDRAPAENAASVPMLFIAGGRDDIVPSGISHVTADALKKANPNAPVFVATLRGRGHDIALDNDEGWTVRFLTSRRRDPFPRRVHLKLRDLRYPRRYWIEILEKSGRDAEVDARIEADNTVLLDCRGVRRLRLLLRPELVTGAGIVRVKVGGGAALPHELSGSPARIDVERRTGDPLLDEFFPIEVDLGRTAG